MNLIEPYAGMGAYSVYALWCATGRHKDVRKEPPVSRMGNKARFAPKVLAGLGLNRVKWSGVWLNDLDPVCQMFHRLYADPCLREAVARRIWAWVPCPSCLPEVVEAALAGLVRPKPDTLKGREGCDVCAGTGVQDARQLWERLRRSLVPEDVVEAMGVACYLQARAFSLKGVSVDGGTWVEHGWKPEYELFRALNGDTGTFIANPRHTLAASIEALPDVVATACYLQARAFSQCPIGLWDGQHPWGMMREGQMSTVTYCPEVREPNDNGHLGGAHCPRHTLAARIEALPTPIPMRLTGVDAAQILPDGDVSDCIVVLDPPYIGTTGYAHGSCRETVLALARAWNEAGAIVVIHEACPLADVLGSGWHAVSGDALVSRKSNFWKDGKSKEWITVNRPWSAVQPVQGRLF